MTACRIGKERNFTSTKMHREIPENMMKADDLETSRRLKAQNIGCGNDAHF